MTNDSRRELGRRIDERIRQDTRAAQQVREHMATEWQRAIGGATALPVAVALSWATVALYAGLFFHLGLRLLNGGADEVERGVDGMMRRGEMGMQREERDVSQTPRA